VKDVIPTLPFVAEDLGNNMERAYALRDTIGLPGMKVLQFAWGVNMPVSVDTPHNYTSNCIVYTGTHDNNTTTGWYKDETTRTEHERINQYCGIKTTPKKIHAVFLRLAYASVANTAIVPIQDILGLGSTARMNVPGSEEGNWRWRLQPDALTGKKARQIARLVKLYNRD
jgi:4-alpha-glucanotransferase